MSDSTDVYSKMREISIVFPKGVTITRFLHPIVCHTLERRSLDPEVYARFSLPVTKLTSRLPGALPGPLVGVPRAGGQFRCISRNISAWCANKQFPTSTTLSRNLRDRSILSPILQDPFSD